jgi:hypothetical protein
LRERAGARGGNKHKILKIGPHPALRATPGSEPGGRLFSRGREKGFSPTVRALVDFLVERFGPDPYWDVGA